MALAIQTAVMGLCLCLSEPGELGRAWHNKGKGARVDIASMLGSAGWFTTMPKQNAAYARAVGQVELIFNFLTVILILCERIRRTELLDTVLIIAGILLLLVGCGATLKFCQAPVLPPGNVTLPVGRVLEGQTSGVLFQGVFEIELQNLVSGFAWLTHAPEMTVAGGKRVPRNFGFWVAPDPIPQNCNGYFGFNFEDMGL